MKYIGYLLCVILLVALMVAMAYNCNPPDNEFFRGFCMMLGRR